MLILNIEFPDTLAGKHAVEKKLLPCRCWIGHGEFQIKFSEPLFSCTGFVKEWDQKKIDLVAPALGGSNVSHDNFAEITLTIIEQNTYKIETLSLFYASNGWTQVITKGEYAEFVDEEDW